MIERARPRNAASVILVRPDSGGGFEVFMTRRPPEMKFLGGMYVFPGGTVQKPDCANRVLERCRGLSAKEAHKVLGATLKPELCLGHWVAGIRELFEEVGVLLCVTETGQLVDMSDERRIASLTAKRNALIEEQIDFAALLESEKLFCDLTKLAYFSHWQTPGEFALRFNTRFYIAQLPPDQTPLPCSEEVTHSLWVTPEKSLQLSERGSLPVIFPTFACLRTLAEFDSAESLCAEYRLQPAHPTTNTTSNS